MKLTVFGLSVSSSWGNGHATLWRGLIRALARRGWTVVFYEHDLPWYAGHRDIDAIEGGRLVLYRDFADIRDDALADIRDADVAMVTSYCPDAITATEAVLGTGGGARRVFYDLDTPVTLAGISSGETPDYIGPDGLAGFDHVLSYTGGAALDGLRTALGAHRVDPLYGHVDPEVHRPADPDPVFAGDLSYLGTYAPDRQDGVTRLLVEPARRMPGRRFVIGGAMYPADFPWTPNIHFVRHLPPTDHPRFYASSDWTLNVTRRAMAQFGWCPSGRLFEAAACGAAILTDTWPGLEEFFRPGEEILPVNDTDAVAAALDISPERRRAIGRSARDRVLADHTSDRRAATFEDLLGGSRPAETLFLAEGA